MAPVTKMTISNDLVPTQLPAHLVAIFVGGTSGLGEAALKAFVKHAASPHAYVVGRSQERGERIISECKVLNPDGEYTFLQADLDLMKNVDDVCDKIKARESVINLLFLSQGSADKIMDRSVTSDGLNCFFSTNFYGRTRFALNLLPLLQSAASIPPNDSPHKHLARVVTVAGGTKEGSLHLDDIPAFKVPIYTIRDHVSTMITFTLEELQAKAPEVSFVHYYPGFVRTRLFDTMPGLLGVFVRTLDILFGRWLAIPNEESGERMLFVGTSERYAPGGVDWDGEGATGTTGEVKSGVYSIDEHGEPAGPKVLELLRAYRADGSKKKVWDHVEGEFRRIDNAGENSES